jgi:hypothetical protein
LPDRSPFFKAALPWPSKVRGMTDVLAIVEGADRDEGLLEQLARRPADRVTVLVEEPVVDWAADESDTGQAVRDRLARLLSAIEVRTGAIVVGLAGSREQLRGWRFDRIVGAGSPRSA